MNALLLLLTFITFVIFYYHSAKSRLGAASGFATGIVYFTILPILLLAAYGNLAGIAGTRIPPVSWTRDAGMVGTILAMSILTIGTLTLILNWYPRVSTGRFDAVFEKIAYHISDRVLFVCYLSVATGLFFATGLGSDTSHWATSRNEFMAEQGSLGGILMAIPAAFKFIILFRLVPVLFQEHKRSQNWFIMLGTVLFDLYTSGTRIFVFQFLAVLLFDRLRVRDYRPVILLAISAFPIAAAMETFTVARTHLSKWDDRSATSAFSALQTGVRKATERVREKEFYERTLVNITESTSLGVLKHVYLHFGVDRPFLNGITLAKPLVAWIPRSVWPAKPHNFSYIVGREVVGPGVSVGATSLGEFYGNFGILGGLAPPFILLLYAWLFAQICQRHSPAFPYVLFNFGIATARNGLLESAIPLILSLVVMNIVGHSDVAAKIRGLRPMKDLASPRSVPQ